MAIAPSTRGCSSMKLSKPLPHIAGGPGGGSAGGACMMTGSRTDPADGVARLTEPGPRRRREVGGPIFQTRHGFGNPFADPAGGFNGALPEAFARRPRSLDQSPPDPAHASPV